MKIRPAHIRERIPTLDLISMVDLVFLLIIFFLTTSTFIERDKAKLTLPMEPGESFQEVRRTSLIINISRNGSFIISGDFLSIDQILQRVREEISFQGDNPDRLDLIVRADRYASVAVLNELARGLTSLNVRGWKLATEVPTGPQSGGGSSGGGP